jgi:hypothetical protein
MNSPKTFARFGWKTERMENMKPDQSLSLLLLICLAACTPASTASIPAGTIGIATATPELANAAATLTPPPTPSLPPTEIPIPVGLSNVPEGYAAVRNVDGSWGYGVKTDTEVSPIPNLTVDASGAHFFLGTSTVDIPLIQIQERIKVGQAGALQVYNEQRTGIDFAWDSVESRWIQSADVIQLDGKNIEKFITVNSKGAFERELRLEELFLTAFPPDTYWPQQKDIIL